MRVVALHALQRRLRMKSPTRYARRRRRDYGRRHISCPEAADLIQSDRPCSLSSHGGLQHELEVILVKALDTHFTKIKTYICLDLTIIRLPTFKAQSSIEAPPSMVTLLIPLLPRGISSCARHLELNAPYLSVQIVSSLEMRPSNLMQDPAGAVLPGRKTFELLESLEIKTGSRVFWVMHDESMRALRKAAVRYLEDQYENEGRRPHNVSDSGQTGFP